MNAESWCIGVFGVTSTPLTGLFGLALGVVASLCATLVHFEVLHALSRHLRRRPDSPRLTIVMTIATVLLAHVCEIALHAAVFRIAISIFHLGRFVPLAPQASHNLFYLAAEVYSSLGYSDVTASGELRIVVSVAALNGVILLAWSGSFLFALAQRHHDHAPSS